jgi:hypothetical protein
MDWKDPDALKAYRSAYYAANKEKRAARQKIYNEVHKDEILAYRKLHHAEETIRNRAYKKKSMLDITCVNCGKAAKTRKDCPGKFCSKKCSDDWHVRERSHRWRGGISFGKYCPNFDDVLKEEIRHAFGRRCFLSGIMEGYPKLDVHHCDYLKSQGCQGQRWSLLPLSHTWHGKTCHDRWYWFALLRDYWVYKYLKFHGMDIFDGPDRTDWLWGMYNTGYKL